MSHGQLSHDAEGCTPYASPRVWKWLAVALLLTGLPVGAAEGEEEVNLDELSAEEGPKPVPGGSGALATRVPEHDYDRRLLVFPALLVLILAWNVKWKKTPGKSQPPSPSH